MALSRRSSSILATALVLAAVAVSTASASVPAITWSAPQTVSGDSDVDTTGSFVYAYTFGGTAAPPSTTVNGVTFSPFTLNQLGVTSATTGSVTITESPGALYAYNIFGSAQAPFSNLSSNYRALLGSAVYADIAADITVVLGGLTSGQQYRLQWWTNDSAQVISHFDNFFSTTTASAGNTVTLDANTTNTLGGVGQFAIGTFTAAGTSQSFVLSEPGGFNPLLTALQVRAVPEPTMGWLGGVGLARGCLAWRRRRHGGMHCLGRATSR